MERQLSLAFDLFLARTRLESLMSLALQEAGISSGDYAVLSLARWSRSPPLGWRLVGVAPSSPTGRIGTPVARELPTRSAHWLDARSWVLVQTAEGQNRADQAVLHAYRLRERLETGVASTGRRLVLHLPHHWPQTPAWETLWTTATGPPTPITT